MGIGAMLFRLESDAEGPFDGSTRGIAVLPSPGMEAVARTGGMRLEGASIGLARHPDLDDLQAFTIEATIKPDVVGGSRQSILEGETPAMALYIEADGTLAGAVHTSEDWIQVDSGGTLLRAGVESRLTFTRDAAGRLELFIDGSSVGVREAPGRITGVGNAGLRIGSRVDGLRHPFLGTVAGVQIRRGTVSPQALVRKRESASRITQAFVAKTGLARVKVSLLPDQGNSRLQPIKDIMNAAGVERLSDLGTLRLRVPTVMTPGKVLVASRKGAVTPGDWGDVVKGFLAATPESRRDLLARSLTNRNSAAVLGRMPLAPRPGPAVPRPEVATARRILPGGGIAGVGSASTTGPRLSAEVLRSSPTLRLANPAVRPHDLFTRDGDGVALADPAVLTRIASPNPALWANLSAPAFQLLSLTTIPVNSAVMIGSTIDLTDTELVIEPSVTTLYLIAEELVCGDTARITWRRPGGATPPRLANPDLDGRDWPGVQTKPGSRDGQDGGAGGPGEAGIAGAHGLHAPNLEIWVKAMSAMPNLDLNGEDGRQGGRGQLGGHGGDGGDGHVGHRFWFFGWHCDADPGDGGDGGNGGGGGGGGRGGSGGHGGKITIGVLEDTLEATVTSRAFRIKNQGGQRGRGGDGGEGGNGGAAGRSGAGETCHDASDGHPGAKGQPGTVGADGSNPGIDGDVSFFEFTLEEWDALLTRPWLAEVAPTQAFPGDRLTLRGSRFASGDQVVLGSFTLAPTFNPDESISIDAPLAIAGGQTSVHVRRPDGTESNRYSVWIKPQLDPLAGALSPGATVTLNGHAFMAGASVLVDGAATPGNVINGTRLTFTMPGTGGGGSAGGTVLVQVRNPDGMVSNGRSAPLPRILEVPFRYGVHNLTFGNFKDGIPDWGTYEDTFGAAEVWHEQLDPVFGHPILTAAFYGFYHYFLKGEANGGLATGFCTSLASLVADNFWQGRTDTHTLTKPPLHRMLTGVHGKLLSRESLLHFHDQGREGVARVEKSCREIEATFLRGCDRHNAPLLFFIPSGAVWDSGYFDKLSDSHCVMPYRFVYPVGHPGPQLDAGGTTTVTSLDGVELHVWDCNQPSSPNCRLVLHDVGGQLHFDYFPDSTAPKFTSQGGITLGTMTNGAYLLADHDLPFSGPLGLTTFIIDFLLSPADLQVTDPNGLRTGNFGGQLLAEIGDSHPCYLVPGAWLLPADTPLTRRITGTGAGTYTFNSIMPDGASVVLEEVPTGVGQVDELSMSADGTQLRFAPGVEKPFHLTIARQVGNEARAIAIRGLGGGPATGVDVTFSPELSIARIGNRGADRTVEVRAFVIDRQANAPLNKQFTGVGLPANHDLVVTVQDWQTLDAAVQTLGFE